MEDETFKGTAMEFDIFSHESPQEIEDTSEELDQTIVDEEDDVEEIEAPEQTTSETDEEVEEEVYIDDDYTEAAILAESYKQKGIIGDDVEISKELTAEELQELLLDSSVRKIEASKDEYFAAKGYSAEALELAELMAQGIDPQTVWEALQDKQLSSLDIEESEDAEANRKYLIEQMYKDKGLSDKRIQMLLEDLQDTGEDIEEAKTAQEYFAQKEQQRIEQTKQLQAQQAEAQKKAEEERLKQIKDLVQTGDFYGLKLESEDDKEQFYSFLTDRSQVMKVPTRDGKEQLVKVTEYEKKLYELQQDSKKQMAFARLLQKDFNLQDLEEAAVAKNNRSLLDRLNGKTTKRVKRSGSGEPIKRSHAAPAAEFDIN